MQFLTDVLTQILAIAVDFDFGLLSRFDFGIGRVESKGAIALREQLLIELAFPITETEVASYLPRRDLSDPAILTTETAVVLALEPPSLIDFAALVIESLTGFYLDLQLLTVFPALII